jgi:uncharacterized protein YoxC
MIYILSISIGLNIYFIIRQYKVNKLLKEISDLDKFVNQEMEKTRIQAEELKRYFKCGN